MLGVLVYTDFYPYLCSVMKYVLDIEFEKYYQSVYLRWRIKAEKAGKDIGFEKALLSWVCNHREKWRNK